MSLLLARNPDKNSTFSHGLSLDPVCQPVDIAADLGIESRVDPAALAAAHYAHDGVPAVEPAHQGAPGVLLARIHRAAGAELARTGHVPLVQVVAVVLGHVAHGQPGRPDAVRVATGVVVLSHPPAGDLAVLVVQLGQRVVGLRDADGGHVHAVPDQGAVPVRVQDDEGDVVPPVSSVLPEGVEPVVLDDGLDPEGLLVGVGLEDVVVPYPGEPGVLLQVVGEAVGGREQYVRGQDRGRAHEQGLTGPEEHE